MAKLTDNVISLIDKTMRGYVAAPPEIVRPARASRSNHTTPEARR